ncbi:hypothetical protein CPU12_06060 [Malaciobacter molluscorum LMG 25693]|uniref:SprT-like domain-containing protein n=1 Tax=Malaciobacter molluscorum LMG 25693 TaxID=870501 RepID=A0A2G1DIJ5_9BACT|nr:SprT-like domain-containing protein [Malaciobacter molluscorum]AXX91872.1 SprT-like domain-containing protein [Malaciobacter molluscorum LMG 25693]PHO18281.1 hypothetical protein CPU12_06060 [Malaciobacter molluscorum LMG 25693]RXJ94164.1 hypothetical protein CRV00_08005 [Malaciobacter molluscorum]
MQTKRLMNIFLFITTFCLFLLIYIWYNSYIFNHNPLSEQINKKIKDKTNRLKNLSFYNYKITHNFPIIISDKLKNNEFGRTIYSKNKDIIIYLNKNRFKENSDYMINSVLPHEYAHAVMFYLQDFSNENGSHTKKWQKICENLEGKGCNRFVNNNDIIIEKTNLF